VVAVAVVVGATRASSFFFGILFSFIFRVFHFFFQLFCKEGG